MFIAKVRERVKNGSMLKSAVIDAVEFCIKHDYLRDYFRKKYEEEVFDMLNFALDQERALEVRAEEAMEKGMEKGIEKGLTASIHNMMERLGLSMDKAMDVLEIPPAERAKYAMLIKG